MGDGILYLGTQFINNNTALGKLKTTSWKYGDDITKRPFSVKAYRSDPVDRIRSTMYHEFAHHIHQMKLNCLHHYNNTLFQACIIQSHYKNII